MARNVVPRLCFRKIAVVATWHGEAWPTGLWKTVACLLVGASLKTVGVVEKRGMYLVIWLHSYLQENLWPPFALYLEASEALKPQLHARLFGSHDFADSLYPGTKYVLKYVLNECGKAWTIRGYFKGGIAGFLKAFGPYLTHSPYDGIIDVPWVIIVFRDCSLSLWVAIYLLSHQTMPHSPLQIRVTVMNLSTGSQQISLP